MKKMIIRIFAVLLVVTISCASLPLYAFAAEGEEQSGVSGGASGNVDSLGYFELNDGYASVRVSKKNGGYSMSTVEGDVITKSDNDAGLVYSDAAYDTSFTSFRVTREGKTQDYIFGRDYSHLGVTTSDVVVYKSADNAVVAEWTVDGILFKQTIALMGADTYQHGMAYISYSATNTTDRPIDRIRARVMIDTALGQTDYGYYMLAQNDGSYTAVEEEKTISGADYYNYFFAYDDKVSPNVTSYTLNASIDGESIVPEKVTFAHWYNLASNVFDYTPSVEKPLKFAELYGSVDHLTQDSAVAMYYDMSSLASSESSAVALYYGVYSNYNAGDADVALNFTSSGTMFFNEDETAYKDLNGELPGNFSATFKVQNIADNDIAKLAVAIYPEEEIYPHNGNGFITDHSVSNPYYKEITELKVGEVSDVRFDFKIDPTFATGYRKIKIVIYNTSVQSTLGDENTVLEEEFYVLCPGAQSAEIGFTGMTPASVFVKGMRYAYITGTNFGLIRDKSQYRIILRPQNGGDDVVLDQDKVVINTELNTATLVLDMELDATTYDIMIDWNDVTIEDMTSDALKLIVTDVPQKGDPGYVSSGVYGIAAIIRDGRHYDIVNYASESDFETNKPEEKDIMLIMRGNFNFLSTEEKGNFNAEAITLMEGDTIMINDTLEVRNGRVTVTKNFDGEKQKDISVDIDGKVYTTKANTKVWDGVLAITAFEEGKLYTLPVYSENGERTVIEGEEGGEKITLLWPGAASGAQTLAGLLINLNYGEFALMKQGGKFARVLSFGASLDPSILVPGGRHGTDRYYSNLEKKQLEMGVSAYSAEQLRATDTQFKKDQASWRAKQAGTLNLYMDDILFGSGGFIGFNTMIEVGIPSYAEGLPYVQGMLYLKIINEYWEFGVEGEADMMVFEMEAPLHLKSYNGIPVPDSFYFFIGGAKPGLPIDPFGVFWVRGAGAGIGEIYETFFGGQKIPPLTLMISGEFALFSVLEARADITLSAQGFSGYLNKVGVAGVTIIDRVGGEIYWYPNFSIAFGIRIDILDAIIGEGSIVAGETQDGMYFGGFAKATVKIPDKIWLIGGIKVGEASIGIDTKKVWGSVKVIGIGVGVVYYWGGDVDVSVGKTLNVPEPIMMRSGVPVYSDPQTGRVLYMSLSNQISMASGTTGANSDLIISSGDKLSHEITLDARTNEDILLSLTFSADNPYMAEDIKNAMRFSFGEEAYALEWFDSSYEADSIVNKGTNALFRYNEETKTATVSVSFTDTSNYGRTVSLRTAAASEVEMYTIVKSVVFDAVEPDGELSHVTVTGSGLEKVSRIDVFAVDELGSAYPLAENFDVGGVASDTVTVPITVPEHLPTGHYTIQTVGTVLDENGEKTESPMAECELTYVNPEQPNVPTLANAGLGGNYTLSFDVKAGGAYDGFITNIYEVTEDGHADTVFADIVTELTDEMKTGEIHTLILGGRTASTDETSEITSYIGLEAGKKYVVAVQSYKVMSDGSKLLSVPLISNEVMMVMPTKTTPVFSIENSVSLQVGQTQVNVDTVNTNDVTVRVSGAENVTSATYKLGDGETVAWDGGDISFEDLADGAYTLTVQGVNHTMDSFSAMYQFAVDTESPSMLISSHQGGGFFSGNTITVAGIAEAGARIEITVGDGLSTEGYADGAGMFAIEVEVDDSYAYQDILVYAYDAVNNRSMPFGCTLTNELLGDPDLKAVVLSDGKEVSEIVCSDGAKQLAMAFRSGNQYITINKGSLAASRIEWSVQAIEKSATITSDGILTGDDGAKGIVVVMLDNQSATVELVAVDLAAIEITPVIPDGGFVYDGQKKEPALRFDTDVELVEGKDYTVSYVNNVSAGTASAVITATKDGKCVGTHVVSFRIDACDLSTAILDVTLNGKNDPAVKVKLGELELVQDRDYTWKVTFNADGSQAIIDVNGMGNYKGFLSRKLDVNQPSDPNTGDPSDPNTGDPSDPNTGDPSDPNTGDPSDPNAGDPSDPNADQPFDHLIWIIPTATAAILGLAFAALQIVKAVRVKKKKEAAEQADIADDTSVE